MSDLVNNPRHYGGAVWWEHVSICEAQDWDYLVGNATKYLWRAGIKSEDVCEDLQKADWYVARRELLVRRRLGRWSAILAERARRSIRTLSVHRQRREWSREDLLSCLHDHGVLMGARAAIRHLFWCGHVSLVEELILLRFARNQILTELRDAFRAQMNDGIAGLLARLPDPVPSVPVHAVGDPDYGTRMGGFDCRALGDLLGIPTEVAVQLIASTSTTTGDSHENMAFRLRQSANVSPEAALDLVRVYCNCVRWADRSTPYRIDVDPEDTTRIG